METNLISVDKFSVHTKEQEENGVVWNLTQHIATPDQREQGVVDLSHQHRLIIIPLLTFENIPTSMDMQKRAIGLVSVLEQAGAMPNDRVMIGGATFFMEMLRYFLKEAGFRPVFAFSKRESIEKVLEDGTISKMTIFKHLGFVEIDMPE